MPAPFFSFIIPVYNRKGTLGDCLSSLLNAPFQDYEIILVDDASTDGSDAICRDYAAQYPSIRCLCLPENHGPGNARNEGLRNAAGDYIFFLDSDDQIIGQELARIAEKIKEYPQADIIQINYTECTIQADGEKTLINFPIIKKERYLTEEELLDDPPLWQQFVLWTFFFKRSFLLENKIKIPDIRLFEDRTFKISCVLLAKGLLQLPACFYLYHINAAENRLTTTVTPEAHFSYYFEAFLISFKSLPDTRFSPRKRRVAFREHLYFFICTFFNAQSVGFSWDGETPFSTLLEQRDDASAFALLLRSCIMCLHTFLRGNSLYLCPAGRIAKQFASALIESGISVDGFIDNDPKGDVSVSVGAQGLLTLPCVSPEQLGDVDRDIFIFVSSRMYGQELSAQFLSLPFARRLHLLSLEDLLYEMIKELGIF